MNSIVKLVKQLVKFIAFVSRVSRALYPLLALALIVLGLEYAATSLMIPMAPGEAASNSPVTRIWTEVATAWGLPLQSKTWLWLFFLVMMIRLLLGYLLSVMTTWLGKRVHQILSKSIFSHILLEEPMSEVYTRSVGHYITMAGDDTFKSGTIISSLLQTIVGFLTATVGMVVLYQFSSALFAGVVLFLSLIMVALFYLLRWVVRENNQAVSLSRESRTIFVEALNSIRSIRSLHSEKFLIETYSCKMRSYIRMLVEIDAVKMGVKAFPAIVLLLLASIGLRPGVELEMGGAALFAGTVIVIRVFASLGQMVTAGSQLLTDMRAIHDIGTLIAQAEEEQKTEVIAARAPVRVVELSQIAFGYGDRGCVLDGVSFRFERGGIYAIVGPSGAGKSTLADILLGLSQPDKGTIKVNDGGLGLAEARSRFMLVEQQPKIFSASVRENLLLGESAGDDVLYAALQTVSLDEMVLDLEQGLDTKLTYLGENFSGGQRQRLGIARALIRQPDVLILDEATSALDPNTRVKVVGKLRERMRDGIIIFITHDPEIAALADKVLPIGERLEAMETLVAMENG